MLVLIAIGLVAGVVTSISPCVLPVLPVVLLAGSTRPAPVVGRRRRVSWRPYGVVAGLVVSFSTSTLLGSLVLDALGLPQDLLRTAGIGVLLLVGLGMVWGRLGALIERPFLRLTGRPVHPDGHSLVVGLGAGLLFVPCAGPVLATIALLGATHRVGFDAVVLTAAFGVGVGLPLLGLALAGDAITRRTRALRERARGLRVASGVVMIVIAVALGLNLTDGLQQLVPGYTAALQVGNDQAAASRLDALAAGPATAAPAAPAVTPSAPAVATPCVQDASELADCGPAPALSGIDAWLNTPGNTPLDLAALRGKVVLIDFWTYSCINCQRTLPHLEAWSRAYADAGLVVIGVHTPEFAFEHVTRNVAAQADALGVHYPVAIDNHYATWKAYGNQFWPTEYLIDATGTIRHYSIGEGGYDDTERQLRQLLTAAHSDVVVPAPTAVADTRTPSFFQTQETYLGYRYPQRISGPPPIRDRSVTYRFPTVLDPDTFALAGTWRAGSQYLVAGARAQLELSFQASVVYAVLGGSGTVVTDVGGVITTVAVSGPPTLYPVARSTRDVRSTLTLKASPGVQAYDITFG